MKKSKLKKGGIFIVAFLLIVASVAAVFVLMNHVRQRLDSDAKVNLTQIVTQNKDVISSRLKVEVNNLEVIADKITDSLQKKGSYNDEDLQEAVIQYTGTKNEETLFAANKGGTAIYANGDTYDVTGRKYFRLAIQGTANISDMLVSRTNGDEVFVISVPIYYNTEIVGTVQNTYTNNAMYEICSIPLFASQGYMYIINQEGYVLLHTSSSNTEESNANYFRDMYLQGNKKESDILEKDIGDNKSGFLEVTVNNEKIFSAYAPIEEVHDWYLITSVPTSVVAENANVVVQIFYIVLLVVVLIFTVFLFYFYWYKNRQKRAIEKIAFVDPVTGGDTYNKFAQNVSQVLAGNSNQNHQYAILKFDIDNFKYVNNYFGFDYGDRLLRTIAKSIADRLTGSECIGRISGDNFVVLLQDADEERVEELIKGIGRDEEDAIYISAGVYPISDCTESVNLMVDKAGTASRTVKGRLTNKIKFYNDKFDKEAANNEQLKRSIRQAIDQKQLVAYYQPKVDIYTGRIVGAEALVRWLKADGEIVPPGMFIPMCEETGIITDVDMLVFEHVLKLLKRFLDEGLNCVPISINFSRLHLSDRQFLEKIMYKLEQYEVPPRLIEIELTESAIFEHLEVVYEFTEKLRSAGLRLAMDDFGSGYSSLNMLKNIPIDVLKIDKEFLTSDCDIARRDIIFHAIVQMVHKLNIKVVVEGVEDLENVELMKTCECAVAQGYYYARPMKESDFETVFRVGTISHTN